MFKLDLNLCFDPEDFWSRYLEIEGNKHKQRLQYRLYFHCTLWRRQKICILIWPLLKRASKNTYFFSSWLLFPHGAGMEVRRHALFTFIKIFQNNSFVFPRCSQVPRSELMWILGMNPVLSSNHAIAPNSAGTIDLSHGKKSFPYRALSVLTFEAKVSSFLYLIQNKTRKWNTNPTYTLPTEQCSPQVGLSFSEEMHIIQPQAHSPSAGLVSLSQHWLQSTVLAILQFRQPFYRGT